MGWNPFKDSWSDVGKKVEGYVKDQGKAQEHLFKAGTFQNNPIEELYKGHYYHQGSHPGVGISTDAWNRVGVNEGNIDETAAGIGAGSGMAFGPFGALIGGVAGAGLGAQMGDENSYKDTLRAMGYGAAGGLGGAYAAEAFSGAPSAGGSTTVVSTPGAGGTAAATMGGDAASLAAAEAAAGIAPMTPYAAPAAATMGGDAASLAAAEQAAGVAQMPAYTGVLPGEMDLAASGGNWFTDTVGGGDKMDFLKLLGKGALNYGQAREQQQALEPYTEANLAAMNRYNAMLANPNAMYQNDPGLRQLRENRLKSLEARQLAAGGGTRGGAYSRQLMRETADIDRSNMNTMLGQNLAMMGQTNPYVTQMQGLGGSAAGAAYGTAGGVLDDYASQSMQNQMSEMAMNKFLDYIMS